MYYQINNNYPIISPIELEGFTAYEVGKEPKELQECLDALEAKEASEQLKQEASQKRDADMLEGFEYISNKVNYKISVTKDDGDGLLQVKSGFELGLTETTIHFANGTKLPMTVALFPEFALKFITERNKFFS